MANKSSESRYTKLHEVYVPKRPDVITGNVKKAIEQGWYEQDEAKQLPYFLEDGDRVLEIGGGIGYISTLCARDSRVQQVLTIEANPELCEVIGDTHAANEIPAWKALTYNAVAMPAPKYSDVKFYVRSDVWASSLDSNVAGFAKEISVPVVDLNRVIENFRPTCMIVDIEGGEVDLFQELKHQSLRKIFVELHQNWTGRDGVKRVFDTLSKNGFTYDQWHSEKGVVLFSRTDRDALRRPPKLRYLGEIRSKPIYRDGNLRGNSLIWAKGTNLVYGLNPKAACTTIQNILYFLANGTDLSDQLAVHYCDLPGLVRSGRSLQERNIVYSRLIAGGCILFTCVRDPRERLLSAFYDKIFTERDPVFSSIREEMASKYEVIPHHQGGDFDTSLGRFLKLLRSNHSVRFDSHFRPQTENLRADVVEYDAILHVESFSEGMSDLLAKVRSQYVFPTERITKENESGRRMGATTETNERIIEEIYERDYELFGYELKT